MSNDSYLDFGWEVRAGETRGVAAGVRMHIFLNHLNRGGIGSHNNGWISGGESVKRDQKEMELISSFQGPLCVWHRESTGQG